MLWDRNSYFQCSLWAGYCGYQSRFGRRRWKVAHWPHLNFGVFGQICGRKRNRIRKRYNSFSRKRKWPKLPSIVIFGAENENVNEFRSLISSHTIVSPVGVPRVSHKPVLGGVLDTPTKDLHGVSSENFSRNMLVDTWHTTRQPTTWNISTNTATDRKDWPHLLVNIVKCAPYTLCSEKKHPLTFSSISL